MTFDDGPVKHIFLTLQHSSADVRYAQHIYEADIVGQLNAVGAKGTFFLSQSTFCTEIQWGLG